jgi:hypothetical protein
VRVEFTNAAKERFALLVVNLPGDNAWSMQPFLSGAKLLSNQAFLDLFESETIVAAEGRAAEGRAGTYSCSSRASRIRTYRRAMSDRRLPRGDVHRHGRVHGASRGGGAPMARQARRYWSALDRHPDAFEGTIGQRLGEGSMSMFSSSPNAVLAAVAIQRELGSQGVSTHVEGPLLPQRTMNISAIRGPYRNGWV